MSPPRTTDGSRDLLLVSCGICSATCVRGVTLTCCSAQACRLCAVRHITSCRRCWGCRAQTSTFNLVVDIELREAVEQVWRTGTLQRGLRKEMEERRGRRLRKASLGESSRTPGVKRKYENVPRYELEDLNDPGWKRMRGVKTDNERMRLAKEMFNNSVMSDPNVNLSFHGFRETRRHSKRNILNRRRLGMRAVRINKGKLLPISEFGKSWGKSREDVSEETGGDSSVKIDDIPNAMKDVFIKQLQQRYSERYDEKDFKELKQFVSHYVEGFDETRDFFKFYGQQVSRERLHEMVETEKLMSKYERSYGPVEKVHCSRCSEYHRF